jgi:two-component system nitrogen regulation sensor histidine kinase NtrY
VVESRADSLHRFVQSYRLLAQLPPPQFKLVPVGPLLERVVLLEQRLAGAHRARPAVVWLNADPDQLEQMFINLLRTPWTPRWPTALSRCVLSGALTMPRCW